MEEPWGLHMELDNVEDLLEYTDDEEFLREILQQPTPTVSSESESQPSVENNLTKTVNGGTDEMIGSDRYGKRSRLCSSPRTYILSFDNSTILPATPDPSHSYQQQLRVGTRSSSKSPSTLFSKKRTLQNLNCELIKPKATLCAKKNRSSSQSQDHIMAERKRRQELAQSFIALSATVPGLKKMDKSSILREAVNYVKQLQERVTELEQGNRRGKESMIIQKKIDMCANEYTISSETISEDYCGGSEMLPDVEARVMENEVLIEIHCEKENGVELKILDHLENLHLCVTGSSVLPFGNSTLGITIIAQMGEAYRMTVNDLVKNLRQVLVNHLMMNPDPF